MNTNIKEGFRKLLFLRVHPSGATMADIRIILSELIWASQLHEQTDFVDAWGIYHIARDCFVNTAESGPSNISSSSPWSMMLHLRLNPRSTCLTGIPSTTATVIFTTKGSERSRSVLTVADLNWLIGNRLDCKILMSSALWVPSLSNDESNTRRLFTNKRLLPNQLSHHVIIDYKSLKRTAGCTVDATDCAASS